MAFPITSIRLNAHHSSQSVSTDFTFAIFGAVHGHQIVAARFSIVRKKFGRSTTSGRRGLSTPFAVSGTGWELPNHESKDAPLSNDAALLLCCERTPPSMWGKA